MKRRGLQLSRQHRLTIYVVSFLLLVSGALWAWANRLDETAQAGESLRQFKPSLLKIHGYAAMAFVLLLGTLLAGHVRRAWRARKNRGNGAFFIAAISLLTLSGYALYYIGGEDLRNGVSRFHLLLGLVAPALFVWHIRAGRKATRS